MERYEKSGKKLFQALGESRDMQVMAEWIEKLSEPDDPVAAACSTTSMPAKSNANSWPSRISISLIGSNGGNGAGTCLGEPRMYVPEVWSICISRSRSGQPRTTCISTPFGRGRALGCISCASGSSDSATRWKIFFLASMRCGDDLKELQDLLGEVHDLDVLWTTALEIAAFPDAESRAQWRATLNAERNQRIARYREKMVGRDSLWWIWRSELPTGPQLRAAAMTRLRVLGGILILISCIRSAWPNCPFFYMTAYGLQAWCSKVRLRRIMMRRSQASVPFRTSDRGLAGPPPGLRSS